MKQENYVLTIDFGTQSVRAMIFDDKGNTCAFEQVKYEQPYFSVKPNWAEQLVSYYWECMKKATLALKEKHSVLLNKVIALGVTTFRDSPVLLDKNFEPLRPLILWLDQRQPKKLKPLALWKRIIFGIVGMSKTVIHNKLRTPAIWIQENEPEIWSKTAYYVNISTYLMYRLTGNLADSPANQTGHFPINFKKQVWYKDSALKNIYEIPKIKLCKLVKQGEVIGVISKKISDETGIPEGLELIATGTDKGCETIGTGCVRNDMASISYGTASCVEVSNPRYIEPETFLPAYAAPIPNLYQLEVQIYRGYWMVSWFLHEFGSTETLEADLLKLSAEEILNKKVSEIEPGSNGLVLQPYWGQGLKRPEVRGAIVGFSDVHTRLHIYRAIIEGVAYALREGLEGIERKQKNKVKEIRLSGGGSQSDVICQITADIFNVPVKRIQTYETASLGVALAVFVAKGVFKTYEDATLNMVHVRDEFKPDSSANKKYEYLYKKVYLKLYPRLSKIYKRVRNVPK
ncbi:MAG: FGGY-family carbohydrate kinase [Bacilli bacterium]|jgi:sugar (pentulose or hexulose) kinase|nr:FGGY-family carbohydrate kinase [Bacilli bacterium]